MTLDHLREIALIQISQAQRTNAMTYRIFYRNLWIDTLGPHWQLDSEAAALARYKRLHPELDHDRLEALAA